MSTTPQATNSQVRARLPIDPRIRERRIAVKRQEGRRRLHLLIAGVGAACLVGGSMAASHSALLDVDHVDVTGMAHTTRAEIVNTAGLERNRYLIDVNGGAVARRVRTLPWVDEVKVSRRWPGTVRITVTERTPLARVAAAGGAVALVDGTGRVLATVAANAPEAKVLTLDGLPPAPAAGESLDAAGQAALTVATALPKDVRPRVASIHAASNDITLRLTGQGATTVQFGSADQLDAKVIAFSTMLAKLDLRGARVIDLRVPAAPVLTRDGAGR